MQLGEISKLASGEMIGSFGLTEPDFGSNPGGMRTTARKEGDAYGLTHDHHSPTTENYAHYDVLVELRTTPEATG